jgi:hypothetical protein
LIAKFFSNPTLCSRAKLQVNQRKESFFFSPSFDREKKFNGYSWYNAPKNVTHFLYEYEFSEFIECSHGLLLRNKEVFGDNYGYNKTVNDKIMPPLLNVVGLLDDLEKHYWLAGGTVLGCFYFFFNYYLGFD